MGQDRLATCRKLGMTELPTLGLDHRSRARARVFDTIIRRWPAVTGGRAHHGVSGGNLAKLPDAVEDANAA